MASRVQTAQSRAPVYAPQSWLIFAAIYALTGLAVLAKGPVGFLLPAATIGLFLLIVNQLRAGNAREPAGERRVWTARLLRLVRPFTPGKLLRAVWQMRPITAVVVVAAIALPWYILVGLRTDGLWLQQFFAKFNWRPFVQPILGHSGPIWYHIPSILIGFFPWAVFLGPTLVHTVRRIRDRHEWRAGYIFAACWVGVFFVFWSICSTKLPHYVLPCYPALALLTGCFIHQWMTDPASVSRRWLWAESTTLIVVGIGIMVAIPVVASIYVPGEELVGLVGLTLVAGGGLFFFYARRDRLERAMAAFAVMSVAFLTAMFGLAALRIDRHQNAKLLIGEIRSENPGPVQMAAYAFIRESTVFYAGQTVPVYQNADRLVSSLDRSRPAYVFTTDVYEEELGEAYPGEFEVFVRRPRFLASGEIVVLTRSKSPDVVHAADRMTRGRRQ